MSILNNNGVIFFESFYDDISLNLKENFEKKYLEYKSQKYPNVASITEKNILSDCFLGSVYARVKKDFDICIPEYELGKLWLVKSTYKHSDPSKLPYVPHIDYERYLKVMIYVDDVRKKDGPFHALDCNPNDYENFRFSLNRNYQKNQENRVKAFDASKYSSFVGSGGSALLFDTNCPHFAGQIEMGGSRRVLRFDFFSKKWKKRNKKIFKIFDI